ncbi:MAG: permease-like cell division protein FtsX [Eubacteriales bacterium]
MGKRRRFRLDIFYFIREGMLAIVSHGFMSFAAVCMIVACLLIMGSFSLLAVNMDQMLGDLEAENEFLAYIDDSFSSTEAKEIETQIKEINNVASIIFVSKEEAMEAYRSSQDYNELLDTLPSDVLRDRYRIRVAEIEEIATVVSEIQQIEGIADVSVALDIANGFVMIRNVATIIASILIVILVFISLFIMSNTIKLATFYRREEIGIMKMCGATNGFVRAPFVVEGMILGVTGALFAFFFQWLCYQLVFNFIEEIGSGASLLTMVPFGDMATVILNIFMVAGFTIGVGGSLLAIRKFLQV